MILEVEPKEMVVRAFPGDAPVKALIFFKYNGLYYGCLRNELPNHEDNHSLLLKLKPWLNAEGG